MSDEQNDIPELDVLASANSEAELLRAHRALTSAIIRRRRLAAAQGPLAQTYVAVMEQWDREKADGVPYEERLQHLEAVLRAAWPQTREWHFICTNCHDTGWADEVCRAGHRCNGVSTRIDFPKQQAGKYRRLCATAPDDYSHDYVVPCFCQRGRAIQLGLSAPTPKPEDFKDSGRMTKLGRR